jgi:SNF family Na+-dependent transporter
MENIGIFLALAFYAVVGIMCFAVLPIANFPSHIGIMGVLSLITAYGIFKKRVWAVWLVVALLFLATTFSASMLYFCFGKDFLLDMGMAAYLILTWIFTVYIVAKRKVFES